MDRGLLLYRDFIDELVIYKRHNVDTFWIIEGYFPTEYQRDVENELLGALDRKQRKALARIFQQGIDIGISQTLESLDRRIRENNMIISEQGLPYETTKEFGDMESDYARRVNNFDWSELEDEDNAYHRKTPVFWPFP